MNKLVSKNPILRFKLGEKIVKFNGGGKEDFIKSAQQSIYEFLWGIRHPYENAKLVTGIGTPTRKPQLKYPTSSLSNYSNSNQKGVSNLLSIIKKNELMIDNLVRNSAKQNQPVTPRFLSKYSNMADTIGGANNIKAWLLKLKNYYAPGTYNPDSIWGNNTQAAYERYLEDLVKLNVKFNVSDMPNSTEDTAGLENAREISNLLTVPMELNDFALLKSANYPTNYETTYSNPYVKELFDKVVLRNPVRYTPYYNSNLSYYTPSRFVTFSKEGSKLVSKNPIERFKKNKFLDSGLVTTLKTGGNIPKFKEPSGPLKPQPYKVTTTWGANGNPYDLTRLLFETLAYEAAEPASLIERTTKKAAKKNSKITELQLSLWNSGAFKGVIDKRTGKLVTYERAVDGIPGRMTNEAKANYKKYRESIPLSPREELLKSNLKIRGLAAMREMTHAARTGGMSTLPVLQAKNITTYTEIDPNDYKEFGKWLYNLGKNNIIGNVIDTGTALFKNFTGLGNNIKVGKGTQQQMLGLHFYDDYDKSDKGNNTSFHYLGKWEDKNPELYDTYRWTQLNGNDESHNDKGLLYNAALRPGQYIAGLYGIIETPDNYHITDTYNFNEGGTEYAKKLVESGDANPYDYVRYYVGASGKNKDLAFEQDIPKEKVLLWYNLFKGEKK